jgi:hypothetical protein
MIELVSTKYFVCRYADGFFDGSTTFNSDMFRLYLTGHSIEGGRWEKDEKAKFLFDDPVDAYGAALIANNRFDHYGFVREWSFTRQFFVKKMETFRTIKETVVENAILEKGFKASVNDTIEQNEKLNDSFIKITTKGGNSEDDFVKILKKPEAAPLKVAVNFDPKTVIEEAKRMAAMAGFDGEVTEDMLLNE